MVGRVRIIKENMYHINIIQSQKSHQLYTLNDIDANIKMSIYKSCESLPCGIKLNVENGTVNIHQDAYYTIHLHNIRSNNLSTIKPVFRFIDCVSLNNEIYIYT